MLAFMVGSKQSFEVSLADVSQTTLQGKNDVMLEFHVDDTTGANEVYLYIRAHKFFDVLMKFHIEQPAFSSKLWLEQHAAVHSFYMGLHFLWSNIVHVMMSERLIDGVKFPYTKFQYPVCWR